MKKITLFGVTVMLTSLVGCGGGDDSGGGSSISGVTSAERTPESDAAIKAYVKETNLSSNSTFTEYWADDEYTNGSVSDLNTDEYVDLSRQMVRFGITTQIPIYYVSSDGSNPPQKMIDGVTKIEDSLGDIFTNFILVTADLSIYKDMNYPSENRGIYTYDAPFDITEFNTRFGASIDYGIVYAQGTGFYSSEYSSNPQYMCANASVAPYESKLKVKLDYVTGEYRSDTVLWVNMGNGQCNWSADMVTHETAHNLGMINHIDDYFGLWTNTAMNILSTMYNNPAGTAFDEIEVFYRDNAVVY